MLKHLRDGQPVIDVAVQHLADQIDTIFREWEKGDAERMVKDLVNVVERILLVDDGV